MVSLERSWMRLVARSARMPVPRIVEAGLVTVTRTCDLASSSSGNMFSCSVFITVGRASDGGLVASTLPRRRTSLLSAATQPVFDSSPQDRQSVVEGKSVSVSVDLGGRRTIKKKIRTINEINHQVFIEQSN